MRVRSIRLQDFRSFADSGVVQFDGINVLIGANNSGKSSILRGLHHLQRGLSGEFGDVRAGVDKSRVIIELEDVKTLRPWNMQDAVASEVVTAIYEMNSTDRKSGNLQSELSVNNRTLSRGGELRIHNSEPFHFVVPYFSKRKTVNYSEDIREDNVKTVMIDMTYLAAKLSRLSNPQFPAYEQYARSCKSILGFVVTTIPSTNGQKPGIYLPDNSAVPIEQMGDGVPNIVMLLSYLCVSTGKLFLIEEPENDLHPSALKALLDLIVEASAKNQFVISTHSNIVVSHLCSQPVSSTTARVRF